MNARRRFISHMLCQVVLLAWLFQVPANAADDSEFTGPPIEGDTLKNNPDARVDKILKQLTEDKRGTDAKDDENSPTYIIAHLDDYRKMFWDTYPDKPNHAEAREALAQALFIKDLHYLQADLWIKNTLNSTTNRPTNPDLHGGSPADVIGQAIGQVYTGAALDGSVNPDGGIPQSAMPEFEDWVNATSKSLGPITKNSGGDKVFASTFKIGIGVLSADYRKACDFSGKEYQAYVLERDWAEYDKAGKIPEGYDNRQKYGIYLYYRNAQMPLPEARATYRDMVAVLGAPTVEAAVEKVRTAPKSPDGKLFTKYPAPTKRTPSGELVPDYDVLMPTDISDFFTNQQVEFEALATQSDPHSYLVGLLKTRYYDNQQSKDFKPTTTKWSFGESSYKALCNAFGEKAVLALAEKIRTAPKRQTSITIIDPKALGASRNVPLEAFEDVLSRSDPRGYVKVALAFNQNMDDPGSVDAEAAYRKLLATTDEKALLEAAKRCAVGDLHFASNNPRFAVRDEITRIQDELAHPTPETPPVAMIPDPDFLAWQKFPANVKVWYVIRGWQHDPRNPDLFTGPAAPTERYSMSIKSRTADEMVLWDTEIAYDYPSGAAHPPHDMEVGYGATRPQSAAVGRARGKAGIPARSAGAAAAPATDSGEETLNVAGRSIQTHWTSTTRTSGSTARGMTFTSTTKIWTSDEIPGGLVRKTDETSSTGARISAHQFRETVLESFQGFTPGAAAPAGAPAPAGPAAPTVIPATQPAAAVPTTPPALPAAPASPTTTPAPAVAARKKPARGPVTPEEIAAQKEIMKRYLAASKRNAQIMVQLGKGGRNAADAPKLPADITQARTDVGTEIGATLRALRDKDIAEAQKQIQAAEDNLTKVENFLKPAG